jgi:ABC-2 type transport system ATP-binding protein
LTNIEARKAFFPLLKKFNLLERKRDKVITLSKGMRQKVALIRALTTGPRILFLDEPTAGLDPLSQQEVREMIKQYAGSGMTIFFSSHNLFEVEGICGRIGILKKSKLLKVDSVNNLLKNFGKKRIEITIKKEERSKASRIIENKYPSIKLESNKNKLFLSEVTESLIPQINEMLVMSGISVSEIKMQLPKLENIYRHLMKE